MKATQGSIWCLSLCATWLQMRFIIETNQILMCGFDVDFLLLYINELSVFGWEINFSLG